MAAKQIEMNSLLPWIGIALGDVTGIGPEVTLKALATLSSRPSAGRYLIVGDPDAIARANHRLGLSITPFTQYDVTPGVYHIDPRGKSNALPRALELGAPEAALAALDWLRDGAARCQRGELGALVTAPVSKAAIVRAGVPFTGQTEFLSDLAGTDRTIMMLLGADDRGRWLRVALVTTHLPLARVAAQITTAQVELAIDRAAEACRNLELPRARVGVCGLNPHAGESGQIGTEEIDTITPAVTAARQRGLDVAGPIPADALFHQAFRGDFDAVVAMYHDQGLAPLKMVAFETGVNWTLGLPYPRTSPDHGTAYDLAGHDRANPRSMEAAIRLAQALVASSARQRQDG
jgi:4-hydroxythreonine-4-phosphate dehydrogenase